MGVPRVETVNVLVNWELTGPALHPLIAAVDPRVRVLWGGELAAGDPRYATMLAAADVIFGIYRPAGLEERAPNLRWLQFVGAGVEWYTASGLAARGITVTTASGVGGFAIAEYVLAGILTLLKSIPERLEAQKAHRWQGVQVG